MKKNKHLFILALTFPIYLACCLLLLSGCGFTLRSQQSLPPQLNNIYFQAEKPYGQLEVTLKNELRASGIKLPENINDANLIFRLAETTFTHTSDISSGPSTQARIYHLALTTSFSITDAKGKILLEPQTVTSARDLTLNANEIFYTSTQVDVIKQSMQRELLTKIFNLLSSQKTFNALSPPRPKKSSALSKP